MAGEAETLRDWKIGLDVSKGCSSYWLFEDDLTTTDVKALVDTTGNITWALDFHKEDWFL